MSKEILARAAKAPSDLETLIIAVSAAPAQAAGEDALLAARLRGVGARNALAEAGGGLLKPTQVAKLIGISRAAVHKRLQKRQLLAVMNGRRSLFPSFQFTPDGDVLDGLAEVLEVLAHGKHEGWAALRFFVNGNARLGGKSPADDLRAGKVETVLRAAEAYQSQDAD